MDAKNSMQIHQSIKRFRLLAIIFAAFIALLTSYMIFRVTSNLDNSLSTKINIAGKQRLLAQRVLTDAFKIEVARREGEWKTLKPALEELAQSTAQLQSSHTTLYQGNPKLKVKANHSPEQLDALQSLERSLNSIVKNSTELQRLTVSMIRRSPYIDQNTIDRVTAARYEINQAHAIFSPEMNKLVDLYELESKENLAASKRGSKFGIATLIVVLICILLFVIEPTFLIIRRQVSQLSKAIKNAQQSDAVRWRLLTNIGHEFRTPMTAIMGFADLLNEDDLTESERSRLVSSIFQSSTDLTSLIETMLDMSAIEAGQLQVKKQRCDLHQSLTKIAAETKSLAESKNLDASLMIAENCPQFIETDPKRLKQILTEIIENAIKFTESGSITIQAGMTDGKTANPLLNLLEISVADTGTGIADEFIKSIFDPFQQQQDALTREYGGAGLGLSISRDMAKALGGNVSVASTPGRGSKFIITINPGDLEAMKIDPVATKPATDTTPKPLDGYKLLVVDDAKDNRVLLKHILKKTGAEIEFAMDGKQALEAVDLAIQTAAPFDLILMDMQMPVMDGYFATVQLREQGINTPVIAVTAHALEGDRQHCLDSGCNEYLTKPINKKLLIETCVRLIDESQTGDPLLNAA